MIRMRLQSISWFMKFLKEPFSRWVNKQENGSGTLFEARFKSIALLDEEAILAACAYVDLNPVAAGIAKLPEESDYTSIKERIENIQAQTVKNEQVLREDAVPTNPLSAIEASLWLLPIEDRLCADASRKGIIPGYGLENYLMLIDYTGRFMREGKAAISPECADIFSRIGIDLSDWCARVVKLQSRRTWGNFFATTRARLREIASQIGRMRIANLNGCLAR